MTTLNHRSAALDAATFAGAAPATLPHLAAPVLAIVIGSTFNERWADMRRHLGYLAPWERDSITYARIETRPIAAAIGWEPAECFHLRLPRTVVSALKRGAPPAELRECWYRGHIPVVTDLGGDGRAAAVYLAAAYHIEELYGFISSRLTVALGPRLGDGHAPLPGGRGLHVQIKGFDGSTTFPGALIPVLLCLDELLRMRGIPAWRSLILTQPDHASGIGQRDLARRQATSVALRAGLAALERERLHGPFQWTLGDHTFQLDQPLVEELIAFGGDGPAASLDERTLTRVAAHTASLLAVRGVGLGSVIAADQQRWGLAGLRADVPTHGTAHAAGAITVDFDLAVQMLAERYTLAALTALLDAPGGGSPLEDLALGPERDLIARTLDAVRADLLAPALTPLSGLPGAYELEAARAEVFALAEGALREWWRRNSGTLRAALAAGIDQGIAARLAAGGLDEFGAEVAALAEAITLHTDEVVAGAEAQRGAAVAQLERAAATLLAAPDDRSRLERLAAHEQARAALLAACLEGGMVDAAAGLLGEVAAGYDLAAARRNENALRYLRGRIDPTAGDYARRVAGVDWAALRRPLPSIVNLWGPEAAALFYDRYHDLLDDQGAVAADRLAAMLEESGALAELLTGRERRVIERVEAHARALFRRAFEGWSLSAFVEAFLHPELEEALRDPIARAWEAARGWLRLADLTKAHDGWYVETPAGDPRAAALFDLVRRGAPDGVVPTHVADGRRGDQPSLIVYHAQWGLTLNDLAGLGLGGAYRARLIKERAERGTDDPIFPEPRLEQFVDRWLPALSPGADTDGQPPAEAALSRATPSQTARPRVRIVRRRRAHGR